MRSASAPCPGCMHCSMRAAPMQGCMAPQVLLRTPHCTYRAFISTRARTSKRRLHNRMSTATNAANQQQLSLQEKISQMETKYDSWRSKFPGVNSIKVRTAQAALTGLKPSPTPSLSHTHAHAIALPHSPTHSLSLSSFHSKG